MRGGEGGGLRPLRPERLAREAIEGSLAVEVWISREREAGPTFRKEPSFADCRQPVYGTVEIIPSLNPSVTLTRGVSHSLLPKVRCLPGTLSAARDLRQL